jgi:hypothetical protein
MKEYKTGSMSTEETSVYTKAFMASKGKHIKGRSHDAALAVKAHRDFQTGAVKAVDDSLKGKIKSRNQRVTEAIEGKGG